MGWASLKIFFSYKFYLLGYLNTFLNTFLTCHHIKEPYCTIKSIFSTSVFVMTNWEKGIQFAQCWRQTKSEQLIFLSNRQRLKKVIRNSTFDLSTFDHEKSKRRSRLLYVVRIEIRLFVIDFAWLLYLHTNQKVCNEYRAFNNVREKVTKGIQSSTLKWRNQKWTRHKKR